MKEDQRKLSDSIDMSWIKLGRCLGIRDVKLDAIDARWPDLDEKAYRMLECWEKKDGSNATYQVLSEALCDEYVSRRDLAEEICFCYATDLASSCSLGISS